SLRVPDCWSATIPDRCISVPCWAYLHLEYSASAIRSTSGHWENIPVSLGPIRSRTFPSKQSGGTSKRCGVCKLYTGQRFQNMNRSAVRPQQHAPRNDQRLLECESAEQHRVRNHIGKYKPGCVRRERPVALRTGFSKFLVPLQIVMKQQHEPVIWRSI